MDGTAASPIVYFDEGGFGPHEHVCDPPVEAVKEWLDRQIILGFVSREEARVVERLIEDLS